MSFHLIRSNKVNSGYGILSLSIHKYNHYASQNMTVLTLTVISHREV